MSNKDDIIKGFLEQEKQSKDNREGILKMLALKDVQIDILDELIINIDKQIPPLLQNINDFVSPIKAAYDARINSGCRSDIEWQVTESEEDDDGNTSTIYSIVPNGTQTQTNFYGQKYYRKPSNRDYGSNIITEVIGNVKIEGGSGISTIAVTSDAGIEGIKVGDIVTDNLDAPTIYPAGDLPRVTGFGSTTVLGITTTIQGNISIGSDIFIPIGVGNTLALTVGIGVSMFNVFPEGTTVVAITTATVTLPVYNPGVAGTNKYVNANFTRPAFQMSNAAANDATLEIMHVGPINVEPTLILDSEATRDQNEQKFIIIRDTEDITDDFDYLKSPIDPVTVGIIENELGIGHSSVIVNNGHPKGPETWREVLQDPEEHPEPLIGAGNVSYSTGKASWPVIIDEFGNTTYATSGTLPVVSFGSTTAPDIAATMTSSPPPGSDTGSACDARNAAINTAENNLAAAVAANLAEAQRLNALSQALRAYRAEEEQQAWGMLQGAAYEKQREEKQKINVSDFSNQDIADFFT